jgi:hypothetical protein
VGSEESLYVCARIAMSHGELPPFIVHDSEAGGTCLLLTSLVIKHLEHLESKLQVVYGAVSLNVHTTPRVVFGIKRGRALKSISHAFKLRHDIVIFVISLYRISPLMQLSLTRHQKPLMFELAQVLLPRPFDGQSTIRLTNLAIGRMALLELQLVPFQLRVQLRFTAFEGQFELLANTIFLHVTCVFNYVLVLQGILLELLHGFQSYLRKDWFQCARYCPK